MLKNAISWCVGALLWLFGAVLVAEPVDFPEAPELNSAVEFWKRVYVDVSSDGGLLHDSVDLGVVYERFDFDDGNSLTSRKKQINRARTKWSKVLQRFAAGEAPSGTAEKRVVEQFRTELGRKPTRRDYLSATSQIRYQRGQSDRFKAGLVRAGAYDDYIRETLRKRSLPEDLAFLPHVESSFQAHAASKYGAAGMWQFMPSTGRRYLAINQLLDERLDPRRSSEAAASLLADNYAKLGTWPLALTAYNHGVGGMRGAVRKLGTTDIGVICRRYDGRSFGFASRNFYAQFLAARHVATNSENYFGRVVRQTPVATAALALPFYADMKSLAGHWGVRLEQLRELNPAIRNLVWSGAKRLPKDYPLNVPEGNANVWLDAVPVADRHAEQIRSREHTVARSETLAGIAVVHGTSVDLLVELNGLANANRIYPGQKLELTGATVSEEKSIVATIVPAVTRPKSRAATVLAVKPLLKPTSPLASALPGEFEPTLTQVIGSSSTEFFGLPPGRPASSKWRRIDTIFALVDSGETLGHFADWLRVPTRRLRELNNISRSGQIRTGQKLKLDFAHVSSESLVRKRLAYHDALEKAFLADYRVTGTVDHTIRSGESLWGLSYKLYSVPPWLIHRYNPRTEPGNVKPGMRFTIPLIEKIATSRT